MLTHYFSFQHFARVGDGVVLYLSLTRYLQLARTS